MLLTAKLAEGDRPLTAAQWRRMRAFLEDRNLQPGDLLSGNLKDHLRDGQKLQTGRSKVTYERIDSLLSRGFALGVEMSRWEGAGLWVMNYLDSAYPKRLLSRLDKKKEAPPLLFGCGPRELLQNGGLAVVGSRKAPQEDLQYARAVGCAAAEAGVTIVSGGARGIDQSAMFGALSCGGPVIGVLTDRLLERSTRRHYMRHLISGDNLTLISVVSPDTRLNRWEFINVAMERNDYIYCLSDASLVAHYVPGRGGTWQGAKRNLKERWVPLWIRSNSQTTGDDQIKQLGAKNLPVDGNPPSHLRHIRSSQVREVVLLLTVPLSDDHIEVHPLDFSEWGAFAQSLRNLGYNPADLLNGNLDLANLSQQQQDIGGVSIDRIQALLRSTRQTKLGDTRDTWDYAGLWTVMRSDPAYPRTLRKKLRHDCPAILFGCGDRMLLKQGGTVVAEPESLEHARAIGAKSTEEKKVLIVRGDTAHGRAAMASALEQGGRAIAVLAGGLHNFSTETGLQEFIDNGSLVLVSAVHPEAEKAPEGTREAIFHDRCLRALLRDEPPENVKSTPGVPGTLQGMSLSSVGIEHVGLWALERARLPALLKDLNFDRPMQWAVISVIVSRLARSDKKSQDLQELLIQTPGLEALVGGTYVAFDDTHIEKVHAQLIEHRQVIEQYLFDRSLELFESEPGADLYDLGNVFPRTAVTEKQSGNSYHPEEDSHEGASLILGLVVDKRGFVRKSAVFRNDITDDKTLAEMLKALQALPSSLVAMNRCAATECRIPWLQSKGYRYVSSSRQRSPDRPSQARIEFENPTDFLQKEEQGGELWLHPPTTKRRKISRTQIRNFEKILKEANAKLSQKGTRKRLDLVEKSVKGYRKKYRVSIHYHIKVVPADTGPNAQSVEWKRIRPQDSIVLHPEMHCLRTNEREWREEETLKNAYMQLLERSTVFRALVPSLNFPKTNEEGVLFASVIAYQLTRIVCMSLKSKTDSHQWEAVRDAFTTSRIHKKREICDVLGIARNNPPTRRVSH